MAKGSGRSYSTTPAERMPESCPASSAAIPPATRGPRVRGAPSVSWSGPDDELLDARKAAELLTVRPTTLLAWAREGRVPVHRLGPRHLRWTRPLLRQIRDQCLDPGRRF